MNWRSLLAVALCLSAPGCSVLKNVWRVSVAEPHHYHTPLERHKEAHYNRKLAQAVWNQIETHSPDVPASPHYAQGFQDGFADYLMYGGPCTPPLVPPRKYWKADYQTPQGRLAIEEWFSGFRDGAAHAEATGYREWVVLPVALQHPPAAHSHSVPAGAGLTWEGAPEPRPQWTPEPGSEPEHLRMDD